MYALTYANKLIRNGQIQNALSVCRKIRSSLPIALQKQVDWNIRYYGDRVHAAPAQPAETQAIDITLTTIKARLPAVAKVIESLHRQTMPPRSIQLHVSQDPHLLDDGIQAADLEKHGLNGFAKLQVHFVDNTGPYRKIMPYLDRHFSQPQRENKLFITVDDDTLYPPDFIETLTRHYRQHQCVIAFRGRKICFESGRVARYGAWPPGTNTPSLLNIPTGKDGVLYSTSFFTSSFLNQDHALAIAPTADDLWIKWHTYSNGISSLIISPEACLSDHHGFPLVNYDQSFRDHSLYRAHNSGSSGNNDAAIQKLEQQLTPISLVAQVEHLI